MNPCMGNMAAMWLGCCHGWPACLKCRQVCQPLQPATCLVVLFAALLYLQDLQAVDDAKQHLATSKGQAIPEGFVKVVQMRPAREGGQQHH